MSISKNLMVTLTEAELEQLGMLSNWLGCSKSRVISQALNMMKSELKMPSGDPKFIEIFKEGGEKCLTSD